MNDIEVSRPLNERFGWVALDFVNTVAPTRTGPVDALADIDSMLDWMAAADLPDWQALAPLDLPGQRTLLGKALGTRVVLDRLLVDTAAGRRPSDALVLALERALSWACVTEHVALGRSTTRLSLHRRYHGRHPAAALTPIVADAIELTDRVRPARLRRCRADGCLRWFVDTSKGGQRAWCSMAVCGNRAKAARYRARREG